MDMQMYNLVKNAMKQGKSVEDIIKETETLAQTAKKELEPKTPIADWYNRALIGNIDPDGNVVKERLITALACYFVQQGFTPDLCFKADKEYRDQVAGVIDRALSSLKAVAKVNKMDKDGASDREMNAVIGQTIWDMLTDVFGM